MSEPEISIIVTMHNEEGNVRPLYEGISGAAQRLNRSYEIIFVNDASRDKTLQVLKEIREKDLLVHYCDLESNVGENWARFAGISKSQGKYIITMDGDFQDDPKFIPLFFAELEKGYKAVAGWRKRRTGNFFLRVLPSLLANFLISKISGVNVHDCGCGYKAYRREIIAGKFVPKGFLNRFSPVIFGVKNSEFKEIEIQDRERLAGKSHYGLNRVFIVFNDILALPFILRGPERWRGVLRVGMALAAILGMAAVAGSVMYASAWIYLLVIASLVFFACFSIQWNLGRFLKVQHNPQFIIKDFK